MNPRRRRRAADYYDRVQDKPAVVYRVFDGAGHLLYIGCTVDLKARLKAHEQQSGWHKYATTVASVAYPSRRIAALAEAAAIFSERPWFNVVGLPLDNYQRREGQYLSAATIPGGTPPLPPPVASPSG